MLQLQQNSHPKQMELWILGVLLFGVVLLAFLGFFKPQEGFQSAVAGTATNVADNFIDVPGISMAGYTVNNIHVVAAQLKDANASSTRVIPMTDFVTLIDGKALCGVFDNNISFKMVELTFVDVLGTLQVKVSDAKYYTTTTPLSISLRDAWKAGTTYTVSATNGYSLESLQVRLGRSLSPSTSYTVTNPNTINPAINMIRCPPGYTFFNSSDGTSMCCKGTINPYTHQCEAATARNDLCTFSANEKDPRPKFKGEMIPECRDVTTVGNGEGANKCPPSLPHFAKEVSGDVTTETCCKNGVVVSANGFQCSAEDLKSTEKYCIAQGTPKKNATDKKMEHLCNEAHMIENAVCPTDITGKTVFQNVPYTMGDREAQRYDVADLKGLTLPTCYRLNEVCIPEDAIQYAKSRGAFTEYDPKTWEYSCAVWSRRNRGELVPGEVKGYLNIPLNR